MSNYVISVEAIYLPILTAFASKLTLLILIWTDGRLTRISRTILPFCSRLSLRLDNVFYIGIGELRTLSQLYYREGLTLQILSTAQT